MSLLIYTLHPGVRVAAEHNHVDALVLLSDCYNARHVNLWRQQLRTLVCIPWVLSAGPARCLDISLVIAAVFQEDAGGIVDECKPCRAEQGPAKPPTDHNNHVAHL